MDGWNGGRGVGERGARVRARYIAEVSFQTRICGFCRLSFSTTHLSKIEMMASRMQSNGGGFCSINLSSGLLLPLLYLLMITSSPVVVVTSSFLIPCRQNHHKLTHHPPKARKSSSLLLPPTTVVLLSAEKSNEDLSETESTAAVSAAAGTSKRSQRKAAERVKKQRQQQKVASSTSLHPEAILKRQQQRQQQHHGDNKRRHHNFAQRKDYLTEGSEDDPINDELDHHYRLLTTADSNNDNAITGHHHNYNHHQLHSQAVSKLDASTKPDEVVKAIKRAQNLHDVHDIVEIAHFLLEEVGEFFFSFSLLLRVVSFFWTMSILHAIKLLVAVISNYESLCRIYFVLCLILTLFPAHARINGFIILYQINHSPTDIEDHSSPVSPWHHSIYKITTLLNVVSSNDVHRIDHQCYH